MDVPSKLNQARQTFGSDKAELLQTHLLAQIAVEYFTIPFYLTGVYSFTDEALGYSPDGGDTYPLFDLQQKALSVAVQEMYHLQEACNLANAFGAEPDIPAALRTFRAGEEITIPHLDPGGTPLTASLGNLPHEIQAMIDVETPDDSGTHPPPNASATYPSIGDLYHATLSLLADYLQAYGALPTTFDPHFQPGNKQVAYGAFATRYTYNKIENRDDVQQAANAIVDQGEGPEVTPPHWPGPVKHGHEVEKAYWSRGRFATYDRITHYYRFVEIKEALESTSETTIGGPVFYEPGTPSSDLPSWAPDLDTCQHAVNVCWSYLLDVMMKGFQEGDLQAGGSGNDFTSVMTSFKYTLRLIWQHGACPSFEYSAGTGPDDVQRALDQVDPLCLTHWDAATREVRSKYPKNACQGLNACRGQGWGGIATEKGNGACATADFHTCQGSNDCSLQGGCGFLSAVGGHDLQPSDQWIPGQNHGPSTGGCQTPIATAQVFNSGAEIPADWPEAAKARLEGLEGTSVWEEARTLFKAKEGLSSLPTPLSETVDSIDYDGTSRRQAVSPTSTS